VGFFGIRSSIDIYCIYILIASVHGIIEKNKVNECLQDISIVAMGYIDCAIHSEKNHQEGNQKHFWYVGFQGPGPAGCMTIGGNVSLISDLIFICVPIWSRNQ